MDDTTIINLSRLMALQKQFDAVANNIANGRTSGFRAQQLSFQEYLQPKKRQDDVGGEDERPASLVHGAYTFAAPSRGEVQITGNPLDLAIKGNSYFAIQTSQGERYTRNGSFSLDSTGRLVTMSGEPVLGEGGMVTVPPQAGDIKIDTDGRVSTKKGTLGRLRLVSFSEGANLRPTGENLFQSDQAPSEATAGAATLLQGAIEQSNVQPVIEMARATEITRSYELASKLLKDSQDTEGLNKLASVPD